MFRISCLLFLTSLPCVAADLVRQPNGLQVGDQYRLLFTTSESRDATATEIEVYNEFVQSVADASPVVGDWGLEWKAVARTPATTAWGNSGTDPAENGLDRIPEEDRIPVYRVDGEQIWFDYQHMWNFLNDVAFVDLSVTELGTKAAPLVWTGTLDGNVAGSSPLASETPFLGESNSAGQPWNNGGFTDLRTELYPLYAISEVITVVPEPSSFSFALLSLLTVLLVTRTTRSTS